jgi:putative glutamine amidotransferase
LSLPIVLIPCDVKNYGDYPFHCVGEKYVNAIAHGANCMPLLLPALGEGHDLEGLTDHFDLDAILDKVDGVFLPGAVSNVHPRRYGTTKVAPPLDEQRDETVFALIDKVLARRMPLFVVCRGFQELNVALGGTLHTGLQDLGPYNDHREDSSKPRDAQYDHAHRVDVREGGMLHRIVGKTDIPVNSLHSQGIATLGAGLRVEATAEDGLPEAASMAEGWVLGVQWHPEWQFRNDENSGKLFKAFGEAIRT